MNSFKGMSAPPLDSDGKFCIHNYTQWMNDNEYWPHQMTFAEYKEWLELRASPLSENVFVRIDQQLLRLTNLKHWFFSVKQAMTSGKELRPEVIDDYNKRA